MPPGVLLLETTPPQGGRPGGGVPHPSGLLLDQLWKKDIDTRGSHPPREGDGVWKRRSREGVVKE